MINRQNVRNGASRTADVQQGQKFREILGEPLFIWIGFSGGPENGARPSPSSLPRRRHFSLAIHHRLFFKDPFRLDGLSYTLTSIVICDLYKLRIANRRKLTGKILSSYLELFSRESYALPRNSSIFSGK